MPPIPRLATVALALLLGGCRTPPLDAAAGDGMGAGLIPIGHRCAPGEACAGSECITGICTRRCEVGRPECPAGTVCHVPGDISGTCLIPCGGGAPCPAGMRCSSFGFPVACTPQ